VEKGRQDERLPKVLLMIAIAAGMWGLVFLGAASVWPRQVSNPDKSEGEHVPQLASLADQPQPEYLPTRARAKANRQRRLGRSLAARVFNPSTSLN
jgi:hypothetical protein